jgi:hypothetical protein
LRELQLLGRDCHGLVTGPEDQIVPVSTQQGSFVSVTTVVQQLDRNAAVLQQPDHVCAGPIVRIRRDDLDERLQGVPGARWRGLSECANYESRSKRCGQHLSLRAQGALLPEAMS